MMKNRKAAHILASSIAALLVATTLPTKAATLTWDNGAATGNWNTTDANFTGAWTNGNTALFGGAGSETVTINTAGISANGVTFNVTGDTIAQSGGNNLTLAGGNVVTVGSGLTATISAPLAGTAGVQVEGGGTLNLTGVSTIDGGGTGTLGLVVGSTSANNTVNLNSSGTMGTITANRRVLTIGGSTFGSNSVVISTPGTLATPSFNASGSGTQPSIGVSSSNNSLLVNSGAFVAQTNGGGTNTWTMGTNAGANSNSVTVTGTGSTIQFGSNQAFNVGSAGSSNTVTVSAGGTFNTRRFLVGANGGDTNSVTVTGTGSVITTSGVAAPNTNALMEIGTTAGSNGNYISVAAGGAFNFYGQGNGRNFSIGRAGDNNYLEVTGSTSTFTANWDIGTNNEVPLSVGGFVGTASHTITDGGTGNHLDIYAGGTMISNTSLYVMGTSSALNLGNGVSISTATVGAATGGTSAYAAGVFLKNATDALNINGGRLIAGANGALVSGAGAITLNGAGTFDTAFAGSTISTPISGIGSFTKEGVGSLSLSGSNTYSGDTSVLAGTLSIAAASLSDLADVYLYAGSTFNLGYASTDIIDSFFIDGVAQNTGIWGALGSGATYETNLLTGTGTLTVTTAAVPEPTSVALAAMGSLGLLALRRRRSSGV